MARQGFQVSLGDHGAGQWIAVFYDAGHGGPHGLTAVGTAQASTPWHAVQIAARAVLRGSDPSSSRADL